MYGVILKSFPLMLRAYIGISIFKIQKIKSKQKILGHVKYEGYVRSG